jgi:beta-barrel assembly-enhancing protease
MLDFLAGRTRPWMLVGLLCLAPLGPLLAAPPPSRTLPTLGDGGEMSLSDERRLGDQIARALYRDPDYLDDPALSAYLQAVWQPLVEAARRRGDLSPELAERFAWTLLIGRDRSVNAFALPGGYLGVHLGLLATVATADELASVLAHELSHVSQRHIARLITRQNQQAPWVIGAMILGALAANAARNVDIAGAAIAGGQALAVQSQLNFSRDMEREADRIGFGIMTEAGFSGQGFVSMFDKLQQAARLNDDGSFPYLRSHPLTTERMADMKARIPGLGLPAAGSSAVSPVYHALMSARARVLSETSADRLRTTAATLSRPTDTPSDPAALASVYGATLAAARVRDATLWRWGLERLEAAQIDDPDAFGAVQWLKLETLLMVPDSAVQSHDMRQRLEQLRTLGLNGQERQGLLLAAQAAVGAHAPVQRVATQRLQTWVALHPQDALAWQTLSSLYLAQQQPARSARAEAEARLARLDAASALDRFKAAQQQAREARPVDHIELSIIDARVRHTEALLREQLRDAQSSRP